MSILSRENDVQIVPFDVLDAQSPWVRIGHLPRWPWCELKVTSRLINASRVVNHSIFL